MLPSNRNMVFRSLKDPKQSSWHIIHILNLKRHKEVEENYKSSNKSHDIKEKIYNDDIKNCISRHKSKNLYKNINEFMIGHD